MVIILLKFVISNSTNGIRESTENYYYYYYYRSATYLSIYLLVDILAGWDPHNCKLPSKREYFGKLNSSKFPFLTHVETFRLINNKISKKNIVRAV